MLDSMVTTAQALPNHKVLTNFGVVRGITVRSRSIVGNLIGGIQAICGDQFATSLSKFGNGVTGIRRAMLNSSTRLCA